MAVKPEEAKAALVETAVAHVRERLSELQSSQIADFLRAYYAEAAPEDLAGLDLYGAALSHWHLLERRRPGEAKVHVYTPRLEDHSWQSTHSVVEIVTDDMPFLVDSVEMALTRRGTAIHLHIHPVVAVRRDGDGRLLELVPAPAEGAPAEALLHVQIDRQAEQVLLDELAEELHRVFADVRAAIEDWQAMRSRARELGAKLDERPPPVAPHEIAEAQSLLDWMDDDHFTFLGYREYELLTRDGEDVLASVFGSGLGILRETERQPVSHSFAELPPEVRRRAREPSLLNLTKANSRATVHRPAYLDYVGVKRFDDAGPVCGERRFLGLYTHTAYSASPWEIPVLRRKVQSVIDRSGLAPGSHDHKALVEILETYPRDELFQITSGATPSAASSPVSSTCRSSTSTPRCAGGRSRSSATRSGATRSTSAPASPSPCWRGSTSSYTRIRVPRSTTTWPRSRLASRRPRGRGPTTCTTRWSRSSARNRRRRSSRATRMPSRPPTARTSTRAQPWPTSAGSSVSIRRATWT